MSYVGPGCFQVTGADRTGVYLPGTLVYIPGAAQPWASVQLAAYSGGNTLVCLDDAVCFSGMSAVGRAALTVPMANQCSGGTALSGGYYASSVPANAYNGLFTIPFWGASQTGAGVSGVAWLGYQFASAIKPNRFGIVQGSGEYVSSVLWQYSDNGSSWTTQSTHALTHGTTACFPPVPASAHAYWRVLANSAPAGNAYWSVVELQIGA